MRLLLLLLCFNISYQHVTLYVTTTTTNTIHHQLLAPTTTTSFATTTPLPDSSPHINTSHPLVQFKLDCHISDSSYCNKVSKAVGAAIDEFTRVVFLKNNLLIYVKYHSFCDIACANDTHGWGTPTSQFTLPYEDGADLNYVYPQALAKQLAPYSSTSVWSPYDVEIEINHDLYMNTSQIEQAFIRGWQGVGVPPNGNYWFLSDDNSIQENQIDFRYVVLHHLLHGLGFVSSWAAYFWTDTSPFRKLLNGIMDPIELQLVTPGPYWFINEEGGPVYITGFQPTMIFDKFLVNKETNLNQSSSFSLSDLAFSMQNFCVQGQEAFLVHFIRALNEADQSAAAHQLWISMSASGTLTFQFQPPSVASSSFNQIAYLNQTYRHMKLMTGQGMFSSVNFEYMDPTLNRPGLMVSHLDKTYDNTPDFLMTEEYHTGQTLEQLTSRLYQNIPTLRYTQQASATNKTLVEHTYASPIGPGVLRILDSLGYSTVLTNTHYETRKHLKKLKGPSVCDDSNSNPVAREGLASSATCHRVFWGLLIFCVLIHL